MDRRILEAVYQAEGATIFGRPVYVDKDNGNNGYGGRKKKQPVATVTKGISLADPGDVIFVRGPKEDGSYDEALTLAKPNVTIVGLGGRGEISIAPTAANSKALVIDGTDGRVSDVRLINIGLGGQGTGAGLHVKGDVRRVRAERCKIEGGTSAVLFESTAEGAVADSLLEDCELCWSTNAVRFAVSGGGDPVTQTRIRACLLHNYTGRGVFVDTTHTADLWLETNTFARDEAGDEPADEYVLADVVGTTGLLAANRFPAAKATAKIALAATVIRSGNVFSDGMDA